MEKNPKSKSDLPIHHLYSMGPQATNVNLESRIHEKSYSSDGHQSDENVREKFQNALPARYKLDQVIGQGGMGEVYKAQDIDPNPFGGGVVAIKRIFESSSDRQGRLDALRNEFSIAHRLSQHKEIDNVVAVYDYGETEVGLYIVMQYIEGDTLCDYIQSNGVMDSASAQRLFIPLARTLDIAHRLDLVHRDIKPSNILITKSQRAYLLDFGIARQCTDADRTGAGLGAGTLVYMSPEQLNNKPPSPSQDIYSFAATLFFAIEGKPIFQHQLPAEIISAVSRENPPKCRLAGRALSKSIAQGLLKSPSDRPKCCMDVVLPKKASNRARNLLLAIGVGIGICALLLLAWKMTAPEVVLQESKQEIALESDVDARTKIEESANSPILDDTSSPPTDLRRKDASSDLAMDKNSTAESTEVPLPPSNMPTVDQPPEPTNAIAPNENAPKTDGVADKPIAGDVPTQKGNSDFRVGALYLVRNTIGPGVLFSRETGDSFVDKSVFFDQGQEVVLVAISSERIKISTVGGSRPGWLSKQQVFRFLKIKD